MVPPRETLDRARRKSKIFWRIFWFGLLGVVVLLIALFVLYQKDLIFGITKNLDSAPNSNEWTMFRRDLLHTGNSGTDTLPQGVLAWTFTTGGEVSSSPAVVDGTVYFGSTDRYIYAVDALTGEQRWAFKTGSLVKSSPIVSGGVVYCGSCDGNLYALDAKTGTKIWSFSAFYGIRSSPAIADGIVYFGCDDYCVYAVKAANGKLVWKHRTDNMVTGAPVVSNGVVAIGSSDGKFYSFDAKDGRVRINYNAINSVIESAAVQNGIVYFADSGNIFTAMNVTSKAWLWQNKILLYWRTLYVYGVAPKPPVPSGFLWNLPLSFNARTTSSPALAANNAFLGRGNDVISLDLTTRKINWTFHTDGGVVSSPALAKDELFIGSEDGYVYALSQSDGTKIWDVSIGAATDSSPAIANGMLYIGCNDGKLYAFK